MKKRKAKQWEKCGIDEYRLINSQPSSHAFNVTNYSNIPLTDLIKHTHACLHWSPFIR